MTFLPLTVSEPQVIAKSSIVIDVKPWDDETDMGKLEECVRGVEMEGLVWGACEYHTWKEGEKNHHGG